MNNLKFQYLFEPKHLEKEQQSVDNDEGDDKSLSYYSFKCWHRHCYGRDNGKQTTKYDKCNY